MSERFPRSETAERASAGGLPIEETDKLIASDKVEGTPVFDATGQPLGVVHTVMIGKRSGRVAYAVLAFDSATHGERYHPLPWRTLRYDEALDGYVVDLDRDTLLAAPTYGRDEAPWVDPDFGRKVYAYYGVPWLG